MRASITGRMSDQVVQGLCALGVRIQFVRFDQATGLPVHQLSTTGGYGHAQCVEQQQGRRAAANHRALGAVWGGGSDGRRSDAVADRPDAGCGCLGGKNVRVMGVAAAGQGSSDDSQ